MGTSAPQLKAEPAVRVHGRLHAVVLEVLISLPRQLAACLAARLGLLQMAACHLGAPDAVVVEGKGKSKAPLLLPFVLIQGPPGTGKTHTVKVRRHLLLLRSFCCHASHCMTVMLMHSRHSLPLLMGVRWYCRRYCLQGVLNVWHLVAYQRYYEGLIASTAAAGAKQAAAQRAAVAAKARQQQQQKQQQRQQKQQQQQDAHGGDDPEVSRRSAAWTKRLSAISASAADADAVKSALTWPSCTCKY